MFRSRALLASLVATLWLVAPLAAGAQPVTRLATSTSTGTIAANGESVVLATGGLAAFAVQTKDSYSGTWEVQCSTDGGVTYDADDEINLTLVGSTSTVAEVTDTVGIWQGNAAGCTHIKVIATAGFAASDTAISMQAISSGGGSGGGGGGGGGEVTNAGTFAVQCTSGCGGSGGVSSADDADFVDGTTDLSLVGAVAESASPTTVTEGDSGAFAMTLNRALKTSLYNPSGTTAFGTAGSAATPVLTVQGIAAMTPILATVTATNLDVQIGGSDTLAVGNVATIGTSVTPGTAAANLGKAEDAAHASGDVGVLALAVRQNTQSDLAADGDNIPLTVADSGGLRVDVTSIGGSAPAAAICDDPAKVTTFNINLGAATGNTELVALNGSDLVYVCNFVYTTGGADTPQLIYGTGTACATGETDLMTFNLAAAGDGVMIPGGGSVITKAPAGNALCLERTNSVTGMGVLTYVRQP